MHAGPITHDNSPVLAHVRRGEKPETPVAAPATPPQAEERPVEVPHDAEEAKGVLRLLEQGHFKGVADVRLRINFHDQIQAADSQAQQQVTQKAVADLSGTVITQLDEIVAGGDLTEEQLAELGEAKQAFEQAVSDVEQNSPQLPQDLQAAFDTLTQALAPLLAAEVESAPEVSEPESPDAATVTEDPVITESSQDQTSVEPAALGTFQDAFAAALQVVQESLTSTDSILPPLSQSSGNGSAYDKFLATYNELYSSSDSFSSDAEAEQAVDLEA